MTIARSLLLGALCPLLLAGVGCPRRGTTLRDNPRARCVSRFIDAMMEDDKSAMAGLISPEWLDEEQVDLADYDINAYGPSSYEVEEAKGTLVTAVIRFASGGAHRLTFRVSQEQGEYYVVPGRVDTDNWIHPWTTVEANIED
jgi:hypothetical protein